MEQALLYYGHLFNVFIVCCVYVAASPRRVDAALRSARAKLLARPCQKPERYCPRRDQLVAITAGRPATAQREIERARDTEKRIKANTRRRISDTPTIARGLERFAFGKDRRDGRCSLDSLGYTNKNDLRNRNRRLKRALLARPL